MAGRTQGCAAIGCLGLCFIFLVAMCTGGGSGAEAGRRDRPPSPPVVYAPDPAPNADFEPREWFYAHGTLNVRSAPRADASLVRTVRRGDPLQLGAKDDNGWARLYGGATGEEYVYRASDLVRVYPPAADAPPEERRRPGTASRQYIRGPRGGCYYITGSGRKQYVDRSLCH